MDGSLASWVAVDLFCEMNFSFLDRVFAATFGGDGKPKLLERMPGHSRKGEAGSLFRKVELKIEPCHSAVAQGTSNAGVPAIVSFLCIPCESRPLFPLCYKGVSLCADSSGTQTL